jgi:hypothetical protein
MTRVEVSKFLSLTKASSQSLVHLKIYPLLEDYSRA